MSDDEPKKSGGGGEGGAPAWVVTWADLCSLLLTFFILLLSFSEMNVKKYKKAVGSLKEAFGVQTEGAFPNSMSSNRPFQYSFSNGAKEWMDFDFSQMSFAIEDEKMCEMEKARKLRDAVDLERIKHRILLKLKDSDIENLIEISMEESELKIRIDQQKLFQDKSDLFKKETLKELHNILADLDQQGLGFDLTVKSYAPESLSYDTLNSWKLSTQRSVNLMYLLNKGSYLNFKEIKLQNEAPVINKSSSEDIDIFVDIHNKDS